MSDLSSILQGLGKVAIQLAPTIVPGAAPAIAAGRAVLDAIAALKPGHPGELPREVGEGETALMAAVRAHAESTFDRAENG